MFYNINDFPYLLNIKNDLDSILKDVNNAYLTNDYFKNFIDGKELFYSSHIEWYARDQGIHSEQLGIDITQNGAWSGFPLYKKNFPIKWYNPQEYFPAIIKHLTKVPNVYFSAIVKLQSKSNLLEHKHTNSHIAFHLCLYDLDDDSVITCNHKNTILRNKGDYAIFDTGLPHASYNNASIQRINLAIGFNP